MGVRLALQNIIWLGVAITIGAPPSIARGDCPAWMQDPDVPACPDPRGSRVLPETYPAMAYVVSENPDATEVELQKSASTQFVRETVFNLLNAAQEGAHPKSPLILLPVEKSTFDEVKAAILADHSVPAETRRLRAAVLKWVDPVRDRRHAKNPGGAYTWQQDYFGALYNPATGQPVLRRVKEYQSSDQAKKGEDFFTLSKTLRESCPGVIEGDPLAAAPGPKTLRSSNPGANSGGNIMGLPGGLCLHGDNQSSDYARQYCGKSLNEVTFPTSWLKVGHVDEILQVIPNPKGASPCDFAISIGSFRKALEALGSDKEQRFFQFRDPKNAEARKNGTQQAGSSRLDKFRPEYFCASVVGYQRKKSGAKPPIKTEQLAPVVSALDSGIPEPGTPTEAAPALAEKSDSAEFQPGDSQYLVSETTWSDLGCASLTNSAVKQTLENEPRLKGVNELIQKRLDEGRAEILSKLKARLGCEPTVVEVPQIFSSSQAFDDPRRPIQSLDPNSAVSLLPNPTNGIVTGRTALIPAQQNKQFEAAIQRDYEALGIKTKFQDTWAYSHIRDGNLHCATHAITVCRPRQVRGR